MVTTLYLIRHGKTTSGDAKRYHGSIDIPLSEEGADQIRAAAQLVSRHLATTSASKYLSYLRDLNSSSVEADADTRRAGLTAVYCSDLSRSARSAELVAEGHGLQPVVVPALRERSFGIWEGMTFAEIMEQYPAEFRAWASDPLRFSPMGGESTHEVFERVVPAIGDIVSRHPGQEIAVVAHGGVNRVILCHILGIPLDHIFRIEQDHAAVNVIEFWEKYPVVKLMNGKSL